MSTIIEEQFVTFPLIFRIYIGTIIKPRNIFTLLILYSFFKLLLNPFFGKRRRRVEFVHLQIVYLFHFRP